jgi:sugar lactone lactonase YvrE
MRSTRTQSVVLVWRLHYAVVVLGFVQVLSEVQAQEVVYRLAGVTSVSGHADGPGAAAQFNDPAGLTVDALGSTFVADSQNHVIRRITPAGVVTTFAGQKDNPGHHDGPALVARFDTPSAVACGTDGSLFVADTGNHTIRKITPLGQVLTLAGRAGQSDAADGVQDQARFNNPLGLAADRLGNLVVCDSGNHAVRLISPSGQVSTLAGELEVWGSSDGSGKAAHFNNPVGVGIGPAGDAYVTDCGNHALRKITPTGVVTTVAGVPGLAGAADGIGSAASFTKPAELALDPGGNVYLADSFNHVIRRVTPAGEVTTIAGLVSVEGQADGSNGAGRFFNPYGLAFARDGRLIVADTYNETIRAILLPVKLGVRWNRERGSLLLVWNSIVGRSYGIQCKQFSSEPGWVSLHSPILSTATTTEFQLNVPSEAHSQMLFRVVLLE